MQACLQFLWYYLQIIFLTLGAFVLCGLAVAGCEALFRRLSGAGIGHGLLIATSLIGTPVHELGHAGMCLLFGHKITDMVLWQPRSADGTLGYVSHTYRRRNPYQVLGNLFIGLGPIFSGLGLILLLLFLCYPQALGAFFAGSAAGKSPLSLLQSGWHLFCAIFTEQSVHPAFRVLTVTVILCTCLHINLSPADIRGSLRALPLYSLLAFAVALPTFLINGTLPGTVLGALRTFFSTVFYLFVPVCVFSLAWVLVALLIFCLRKLFSH